ncbi:MAG TPA: hypothetical protein VFP61_03135 [Acidimicrobiales bacterium]|nr:hypothetical protein [Acidimicrobiales bacterium]
MTVAWQLGAAANAVTAVAYFLICWTIASALVRAHQFRSNRLGAATAMIFFSCGVHHGDHVVHVLLPTFGVTVRSAIAMRVAFDWPMVSWDIVTAAVGVYYWTQRRSYGRLLEGGTMFVDHQRRQREALEINDGIVQSIVAAQLATRMGHADEAGAALDDALATARGVVMRLLGEAGVRGAPEAGDFVRSAATPSRRA